LKPDRVVVVGAGIGGLVAALELAAQGVEVVVVEQAAGVGGKMREVQVAGRALDAGPTVFTMRWVFEELFDRVGERLGDHLTLHPAQTLARHAWDPSDGRAASAPQWLDLFADIERSVDAIGAFAGPAEARRYRNFCARAEGIYQTLERPFLRGTRPNPVSLAGRVGLRGLPGLARISPFATMWRALGQHFHDPRLRQLFGRYATYCGSSPFAATATLMLVAHVEREGVWRVEGGMHGIAATLARLGQARGVVFRHGVAVKEICLSGGRAGGVVLVGGERIDAAAVVFNGDVAALAKGLLGTATQRAVPPVPVTQRSLSALTWNLVAPTDGFPLLHHNVFFSHDYAAEFKDLFTHGCLPHDPTVYVCAQDRASSDDAAAAGLEAGTEERLLCLVNAPPTGDTRPLRPEEIASCEQRTFQMLARCGLRVQANTLQRVVTTPSDFEGLFPATGGALYGQAAHGWRASFTRPGSLSRIPGLLLAGGSTHPGPGVPMAALSGTLAAQAFLAQRSSG
jgi:1-hydroxycarotenoid 3,4-desaturase